MTATASLPVRYFNLSAAVSDDALSYDEQATVFALQGLVNTNDSAPTLFMDSAYIDGLWGGADRWWASTLERTGQVRFTALLPSTLCGLWVGVQSAVNMRGIVLYDERAQHSLAIALSLSGLRRLLPVSNATLSKHRCLAALPVAFDLRTVPAMVDRVRAWRWAISTLLPNASRDVVYSLNRYQGGRPCTPVLRGGADERRPKWDVNSAAACAESLSGVDYAVQQRAFVYDLIPTRRHGAFERSVDNELLSLVYSSLRPGFGVFGWTNDELAFVNESSHGGGAVFASLSTTDLSFWSRLPCADGGRTVRPLPSLDRGRPFNASKKYVVFESNE